MGRWLTLAVVPVLAIYVPTCVPRAVAPTSAPELARIEELWRRPADIQSEDLRFGPWGLERAPDPDGIYEFVEAKKGGVNPGMTVRDGAGRRWKVKQGATDGRLSEGPIEVVLSRVLSAVGYHQPPVYYLRAFALKQDGRTQRVAGGRFRLVESTLDDKGEWSWHRNPFVGTRPYQGLLVILLLFNSSDLKNSNNVLYEFRPRNGPEERWYVVRDLGTALGGTGRIAPLRGDVALFEQQAFIEGIDDGFVKFEYHGWHQELIRNRITPDEVRWACELLAELTDAQWREAFLAGGYEPALSAQFITRIQAKIRQGLTLTAGAGGPAS
jgi:hypothetical protein